jgi:hypothetical protein
MIIGILPTISITAKRTIVAVTISLKSIFMVIFFAKLFYFKRINEVFTNILTANCTFAI